MPFIGPANHHEKCKISCTLKESKLVKSEEHKTEIINIKIPKITDLPSIMRKMGWTVAPVLMERWFNSPAFVMTEEIKKVYNKNPSKIPPLHFDDKIVTMGWFLQFPGKEEEINKISVNDVKTQNSINELCECLVRANCLTDRSRLYPKNLNSACELNALCQVQTIRAGTILDRIDDIYGALGRYSIQIAVIGTLHIPSLGTAYFEVDKLGIYLKDVYEFNGNQYLGLWTKDRCLGKMEVIMGYTLYYSNPTVHFIIRTITDPVVSVYNKDFEEWRNKNKKGGDFIIYSDVYWKDPGPNNIICFTEMQTKNFIHSLYRDNPVLLP